MFDQAKTFHAVDSEADVIRFLLLAIRNSNLKGGGKSIG
jgi:hypothetical protein